jgi:predicted transcriptional regulator YheO
MIEEKRSEMWKVYQRLREEGKNNERIYRVYIRRQFFISRATFYRYLREMKKK